jgi:hypothetical protein
LAPQPRTILAPGASFGKKAPFYLRMLKSFLKLSAMYLPDSSLLTNITVQGHPRLGDILFEKKYITIRDLENRLYADDELIKLPDLPMEHPHYK